MYGLVSVNISVDEASVPLSIVSVNIIQRGLVKALGVEHSVASSGQRTVGCKGERLSDRLCLGQ